MAQQILSTNTFTTAKWIVSATASDGTHTTIAAALTSASSGDTIFIRPGTYTENLTLKDGVNLSAFGTDSSLNGTGKVIISGTCTMTTAGSVTISGIQLQTNSAALLAVTGSAASIVSLQNCYLNATNNTAITFSSSSVSAVINCYRCEGNLGTIGIAYFAHSSAGILRMNYCIFSNSGLSTTANTISSGLFDISRSAFSSPVTLSSTSAMQMRYCTIDGLGNVTAIIAGGSGTQNIEYCFINSGTATAITCTTTINGLYFCFIASSNTNAIDGAGTLNYSNLIFSLTGSQKISTTTQIIQPATNFQRIVRQVFTSTGTYTPTTGMKYCDIIAIGGGGAGGGATTTGATTSSIGGGGGAGEYAVGVFTEATIGTSQSVTIGAAGTGNSGATGGSGGTTSVGATIISAVGGSGGITVAAGVNVSALGGSGGTGGTGGNYRSPGAPGNYAYSIVSTSFNFTGMGASGQIGSGGINAVGVGTTANGNAGTGFGSGGSGAVNWINQGSTVIGGAGSKGVVIITEYV